MYLLVNELSGDRATTIQQEGSRKTGITRRYWYLCTETTITTTTTTILFAGAWGECCVRVCWWWLRCYYCCCTLRRLAENQKAERFIIKLLLLLWCGCKIRHSRTLAQNHIITIYLPVQVNPRAARCSLIQRNNGLKTYIHTFRSTYKCLCVSVRMPATYSWNSR